VQPSASPHACAKPQRHHVVCDGHPACTYTYTHARLWEGICAKLSAAAVTESVSDFGGTPAAETSPRLGEASSPHCLTFTAAVI